MKRNLIHIASIFALAFGAIPNAYAQWVQTNGPYGGDITALAKSASTIFAATFENGIFTSTDDGSTWESMKSSLNIGAILPNAFFISGSNILAGIYVRGLYISTDGGIDWKADTNGISYGPLYSVATINNNIFAALGIEVFRSNDNGISWIAVDSGLPEDKPDIVALASVGTNLFAGTNGEGVFLSTNYGQSWTGVNNGLVTFDLTGVNVSALGVNSTTLFAGTYSEGIFRSTDSGANWVHADSGLRANTINAFGVIGQYLFVATNSNGIFRSDDNGNFWTPVNQGLSSTADVQTLLIDSNRIFAGTSGGVFVSTDSGESWNPDNVGIIASEVTSIITTGSNLYATTNGTGIFVSSDDGTSWTALNNGLTNLSLSHPQSIAMRDSNFFGATDAGLFKSSDNGKSWTLLNVNFSPPITFAGHTLFACELNTQTLYSSTDYGISWTICSNGLTDPYILSLFSLDSLVIAGGVNDIFISTDMGVDWHKTGFTLPQQLGVRALTLCESILFAGTYQDGIFQSTNEGVTWGPSDSDLFDPYVTCFEVSGSSLFAGTEEGSNTVFLTTNKGLSWSAVDSGLPLIFVYSLASLHDNLFTSGYSGGVWRRALSEMIPISTVAQTASSPPQIQSYPNPFSRSTTVTFSSQDVGFAEVMVVNLLGAQVAQLFSGALSAGNHSFTWDASGMAPGMYECIVRVNGQVQRVPMVVTR